MRVIDHLQEATRPLISFEIIPPLRGGDLASLLNLIETLANYRPPFIDITSHAAEVVYDEIPGGYQKRIKRKRPGTLGVCALIQKKFEIDAVPHLLVNGFTTQETEDFLIELHYLGIDNVLAIRGDGNGHDKPLQLGRSRHEHATDLIAQIQDMNKGLYLEDLLDAYPTDFCIGAAGLSGKALRSTQPGVRHRMGEAKGRGRGGIHRDPDVLRQSPLLRLRRRVPQRRG